MWKSEQSKDLGILRCGFWPRVCHSLAVGLWANSSSVKLGVYTGRAWEVSPSTMLCDLFHSLPLLKFCWQETEPDKKWEFFQKTPTRILRFRSRPPKPGACKGRGPSLQLTAFPVGQLSSKMPHLHCHPFYMRDLDLGTHKDASRLQEPSWGS